ncbi:hypothetical protein CSUI_008692 [Cystoisospora suis]|uniref:Uncharacterized protein n=1 Tax=Cystoisospora suis TaxID=483139 RepID=A0A2C6KM05_9APIC|nr:hypothetical protein CSUI_008692 [Cystoisospora suis]
MNSPGSPVNGASPLAVLTPFSVCTTRHVRLRLH